MMSNTHEPTTLRRIVVPLDGSELAEQALPYAQVLAERSGAEILLVRVVPAEWPGGPAEAREHLLEVQEARSYLGEIAGRIEARGVRALRSVLQGVPAARIAAEAQDADLIVMTTHGRSGVFRFLYGSVAEGVLARAKVPVMLVRAWIHNPDVDKLDQAPVLLVPLDGSAFAEAAIPFAALLADTLGGEMVLVRAVYPPTLTLANEWMATSYLQEELEVREEGARSYLEAVARRWSGGRRPRTYVGVGAPVEVIDDAAREVGAALVVMATHGRGATTRLLLGSVAHSVLLKGTAPLVLVRPMGGAGEEASTGSAAAVGEEGGHPKG